MTRDDDFDDDLDYGHCGNIGCNEGWVADCFDGFCVNAEDGCNLCLRRCDWCNPPQVDRSPEGEKPQALNAKHESAVVADDAPKGDA